MDGTQLERAAQRRALGWGLACAPVAPGVDLARDIALVRGPGGRDLALVEGAANLGQALELALTTRLGEDVFNVEFGFDGLNALAEETKRALVRERVRVGVIQAVRRDPRVRRVLEVHLEDRADGDPRKLGVRVALETVTADRVLVELGGGIPIG